MKPVEHVHTKDLAFLNALMHSHARGHIPHEHAERHLRGRHYVPLAKNGSEEENGAA